MFIIIMLALFFSFFVTVYFISFNQTKIEIVCKKLPNGRKIYTCTTYKEGLVTNIRLIDSFEIKSYFNSLGIKNIPAIENEESIAREETAKKKLSKRKR